MLPRVPDRAPRPSRVRRPVVSGRASRPEPAHAGDTTVTAPLTPSSTQPRRVRSNIASGTPNTSLFMFRQMLNQPDHIIAQYSQNSTRRNSAGRVFGMSMRLSRFRLRNGGLGDRLIGPQRIRVQTAAERLISARVPTQRQIQIRAEAGRPNNAHDSPRHRFEHERVLFAAFASFKHSRTGVVQMQRPKPRIGQCVLARGANHGLEGRKNRGSGPFYPRY